MVPNYPAIFKHNKHNKHNKQHTANTTYIQNIQRKPQERNNKFTRTKKEVRMDSSLLSSTFNIDWLEDSFLQLYQLISEGCTINHLFELNLIHQE